MMTKVGIVSMCLLLGALSANAAAAKKKPLVDEVSGQGYGMAGCGVGSSIFGEKKGAVQIFASTTNGTLYNQSFAISSGTLNCEKNATSAARASDFIRQNEVALKNDLARGEGETVASLGKVLNCTQSVFPENMKKNYYTAFPSGEASAEQIQAIAYQSCAVN